MVHTLSDSRKCGSSEVVLVIGVLLLVDALASAVSAVTIKTRALVALAYGPSLTSTSTIIPQLLEARRYHSLEFLIT